MDKIREDDLFDKALSLASKGLIDDDLALFRSFDDTPCKFSHGHKKRMREIFAGNLDPVVETPKPKRHWTFKSMLRYAAVVAILLFATVFCGCMCVSSIRTAFVSFVIEIYDEFFGISDGNDATVTSFMEHRVPSYIPEGYEVDREEMGTLHGTLIYKNENGVTLRYYQYFNKNANKYFDFEDISVADLVLDEDGRRFWQYSGEGKGKNVIVWSDDAYTYQITGEVSCEELTLMAESIP